MDGGPTTFQKMDDGTSEEVQEKDENVCALFATSVPRDIWANPSLAALAGLIDEDEEQNDESTGQAEQGKRTSDQDVPPEDPSKACRPVSANDTEEESSSCPAAATDFQHNGTSGGSGISGARHRRREDTRQRRHDRRASPFGGGGGGGGGGKRGHSEDPPSELGAGRERTRPTTGETQVLMSLWRM
eukprot:g14864.t1